MSIDKITARILQEAKDEAAAVTQNAEQEAAAARKEAEKGASAIGSDTAARAVRDAAVLKERKNSVAELEARKMRLAAKQEMIEKSFEMAKEALLAMEDAEYRKFLLKHLAPYHEGEVILNARDRKRLGDSLKKELEGTGLTVSEDTADIQGGFILRTGLVSVNGSLETIFESEKKQITAQIAKTLFS